MDELTVRCKQRMEREGANLEAGAMMRTLANAYRHWLNFTEEEITRLLRADLRSMKLAVQVRMGFGFDRLHFRARHFEGKGAGSAKLGVELGMQYPLTGPSGWLP